MLAEMLEDVVASLARGPVLLLGHSVGGFTAARLAATHPALVRALILVDAGGFTSPGPLERLFCRVKGRELVTRLSEGAFARVHTKGRNEGVSRMFARIDAARRDAAYASTVAAVWRSFGSPEHDLTALAPSIVCPTLLLWGALDPVLPLETSGRAAERAIPGARLAKLATGHCPFVEDPARFLAELGPFLERVVSRGTPRP
ncbi:MAG: alpha/beta hydrolase [Polyangiaceae bacterium]|nr:alpha/beta hydrolase [Polyangiaceae bacterium]